MRIGINALQMKTDASASKAGLSRYASSLLEEIVQMRPPHEITVFINQACDPPEHWREFLNIVPTKGRTGRMPHFWGMLSASFISRRFDAWLSLAHTLPLWTNTPKVLVVHDLFSLTNPELYVERRAKITANSLRRSIAIADRLIAVSHATKQELIERLGVPHDKIDVTHLGPGNLVQPRNPADITDEELRRIGVPFKRYLFMLSTVEPRKNVPRLIEAFAEVLSHERYKDLGLIIGGGKGWETSDVIGMPGRLGIGDKVRFLGYVADEDLPALFARCEAFVLPSLTEGFGITVLEAMLLGAPVVCSNTGALPEVGGEAAMYFDPTDVQDMADWIVRRLDSDRVIAIQKGFEQAKNFNWRKTAEQTLKVVEATAR